MEDINRIELQGQVGHDARITKVGDTTVARFSLATTEIYRDRDGLTRAETTWHSVTAWQGKSMPDFSSITKGCTVHVVGRLRQSRYTTVDGEEKSFYEVLARSIDIVK